MSANLNIFDQLNQDSESEDFFGLINKPQQTIQFSKIETVDPNETKNIFESLNEEQKEDKQFGFLDTVRDIAEQVATKGIAGAAGAYGNILDTFGLQIKEGENLPGQDARSVQQSQVLEKLNRGQVPSFGELMLLSDDDELPNYSRLPTSKDIKSGIEKVTGIGEGKTPYGRISGRGAEFVGEGAATGGGLKSLTGLGLSGLAGQGIREVGGPEALATGVEIAGSLGPSIISKKLIPTGKTAKDLVESGRKIGLSESQITPLIQAEKKVATLSKVSRKGTKTKELFSSIKEKLGDSYNTIKNSREAKIKLPNADRANIKISFENIKNDLLKTLAPSPDKNDAIQYIEKAIKSLDEIDVTPEHLVNFWQDINKSVKWNSITGGKKSLTKLKEPVSEVLKKISPQLAEDFEMTNELYSKYANISKKLKPDLIDSLINKGELIAAPAAGFALATGNPSALIGLGTEISIRLLGREMLINPYFQNLASKLVKNFNSSSMKGVTESVKQAKEYMERKHPNEDWSFLTKN